MARTRVCSVPRPICPKSLHYAVEGEMERAKEKRKKNALLVLFMTARVKIGLEEENWLNKKNIYAVTFLRLPSTTC